MSFSTFQTCFALLSHILVINYDYSLVCIRIIEKRKYQRIQPTTVSDIVMLVLHKQFKSALGPSEK